MRTFFTLLRQEGFALGVAPFSYGVAGGFVVLMGVLFFLSLERFLHITQITPLFEGFFGLFWLPLLFFVPLLTMRSIAEEKHKGLLETTLAAGATPGAIVLSKFCALFGFYMILWGLCLSFPLLLRWVLQNQAIPATLLEPAVFIGSYAFIALNAAFYVALGLFCSSLTSNPFFAGVLAFCLFFLMIVASQFLPESASLPAWLEAPLGYLQNLRQLGDFSRGILDSRPLIFYLSGTALFLGLTTLRL